MTKHTINIIMLICWLFVGSVVSLESRHQDFLSKSQGEATIDTEQSKMYAAVGNVYNIFTGNPLSPADPGFSTLEAFTLNYSNGMTADTRFKIPNEFYVRDFLDCNSAVSSEAVTGMQSYQKSLQQSCKVEGGYNGAIASASFQANVDYKQKDEGMQKQETVSTVRKISCRTYIVAINDNVAKVISVAMMDFMKKYHAGNDWVGFVNRFGTHYVLKAIYGAAVIEETSLSKTDAESLASKGIDIGVSLEVKTPIFNVGASSETKLSSEQKSALSSIRTKSSSWVLGLGPDTQRPGDFNAWIDKVQQGKLVAQPVDYTLGSLEDLFDISYWPKGSDPKLLNDMKTGFKTAVTKIAVSFPAVRLDAKINSTPSNKIGDGWYTIRNKLTNLFVNADNGATNDDVPYMQFTMTNNADQIFYFQNLGGDLLKITAKHSNKCLDIKGGSKDNNAGLVQYNCHGGVNQQWRMQYNNDSTITIINANSNKALDVLDGSIKVKAWVVQYTPHGGENQRWYLKPY